MWENLAWPEVTGWQIISILQGGRKEESMGLFNWFRRSSQDQRESGDNSMRWSWFGGRRILRFGSYIFPKDAAEGDRLDLQHHLLKLSLGGNYRAPVRQPRAILDVACGTGIWCRELAQEFPNAQVTGFDIDSTPMDSSRKRLGPSGQFPANFHFLEANALKPFLLRMPPSISHTPGFWQASCRSNNGPPCWQKWRVSRAPAAISNLSKTNCRSAPAQHLTSWWGSRFRCCASMASMKEPGHISSNISDRPVWSACSSAALSWGLDALPAVNSG